MILKLYIQHRGLKLYKSYINGVPGLTLTFLRQGKIWLRMLFFRKKKLKQWITACYLKIGRCNYLIIKGQDHFLTLARGHLHMKIKTDFSHKPVGHFEPKFGCKLVTTRKLKLHDAMLVT